MSEKLFRFTVENLRTKEKTVFLGQGMAITSARLEGINNVRSEKGGLLSVTLRDGRVVKRTVDAFEGDIPYGETKPAQDEPETLDV